MNDPAVAIVVVNDTARAITDVRVVYNGRIMPADRIGPHERVRFTADANKDGLIDIVANVNGSFHEAAGAAHVALHDRRTIELHVGGDRIGAVYLSGPSASSGWTSIVGVVLGIVLAIGFFLFRRGRIKRNKEQGTRNSN